MKSFSLLLILLSFFSYNTSEINNSINNKFINDSLNYITEEQDSGNNYYYDMFGPDTIFITNMDNFIVIPLSDLDKTHQISHDFNKDGINETIHIGSTQSNFEIIGIYGDQKYNLHQALLKILKYGWGEDIYLEPKCSIQITYHDLDSDNTDELILSFGGIDAMSYSVVYKVQNSKTEAFSYIGSISGGAYMELWEDNTIWCPIGFQGLGDIYVLKNGEFIINNFDVK